MCLRPVRGPGTRARSPPGGERFLEPRREDCPWCGSVGLRVLLRTGDRFQGKPGRFVLDECRGCGHIFQNPRLTPAGLDFSYRDFYDGYGESLGDFNFRQMTACYRGRVRLCEGQGIAPRRWLDVTSSTSLSRPRR
ncbi:hypothetical protein [Streptomyces chattanoogensis]|uniref:Uncharacterized protein n=1 Tax=Streptomyces chattanoogensis TaxID=66876 RepID=A0A0N0XVG3_9ACTN|nr:hypothetical protein ADL29_23575 [Streptomyces chattanoogensis]